MEALLDNHDLILMEVAIIEALRRGGVVSLDRNLANASLIHDDAGRNELRRLYLRYLQVAADAELPFVMCTPTWRANAERVKLSAAHPEINAHAAQFMFDIRESGTLDAQFVKIGGMVGCKNDCYQPAEALSPGESEEFHKWQVNQLANAGVDFLFAVTLPSVQEAIGIARAMASTDCPYIISWVINQRGDVLDGTPLAGAIEAVDGAASRAPLGYFVNCAYPTFLCADRQTNEVFSRLIGFQGNA